MSTLHTVNKSPFERNSLASCLRVAASGNAVLLLEDGVYAAIKGTEGGQLLEGAQANLSVYALGPDLKARGIEPDRLVAGVELVGYDGFVDLAASHERVQAWL